MKRIFILMALCVTVTACLMIQSCDRGAAVHPVAKIESSIWKALGNGDPEKANQLIKDHYWSLFPEYYDRAGIMVKATRLSERIESEAGGIKRIEVVSVEPAQRRTSASKRDGWDEYVEVVIRITFGNGDVLYSREKYESDGRAWERISDDFRLWNDAALRD